jgi:hypothetical protein
LVVVVVTILYWISWPLEVTLDLLTERVAFTLSGAEEDRSLIEGLPLTALELHSFTSIPLEIQELKDEEGRMVFPGGLIYLKPLEGREARVRFQGPTLRLMRLGLAAGAAVVFYIDQERHVLVEVRNPRVSTVELGVPGSSFTLLLQDVEVLDERGKGIRSTTLTSTPRVLEVTTTHRYLIFEQSAEIHFALVLDLSQQHEARPSASVSLAVTSRPKVDHLDFTREGADNNKVSAILQLRIEPLMAEGKTERDIYLGLREGDAFTLYDISLSEQGLRCQLTGRTSILKVGRERPGKNLAPSLLEFLVNHVVVKTLLQGWGWKSP